MKIMGLNNILKYSSQEASEEDIRFILREINGDRVLVELIGDMAIHRLETIPIEEVCAADDMVAA